MVDWSALTRRLEGCEEGRLELAFVDIERIIGGPLPASSQYPAFWSNSSSYAKAWRRAGFIATRRGTLPERIAFVRSRPADPVPPAPPLPRVSASPDREASRPLEPSADVVLVGCVKAKADTARPARDLYRSPLFQRRRRYAEQTRRPWFILSAEHGLLDPEAVTEPYDVHLADQDEDYRRVWGEWVAAKLRRQLGDLRGRVIEIHASSTYADAVGEPLRRRGAVVVHPMAGLRQGEQLAWYDQLPPDRPRPESDTIPVEPATTHPEDLVFLDGPHEIGSFTFRWPDSEEAFDRGWDLEVAVDGRHLKVRHGLGTRSVYGKHRPHSVTFIGGWAAAEAVAADDYDTSRCLISALKDQEGRIIRPGEEVPGAYAGFPLVSHREQINAPYSRDALAVRLPEDDITSWVGFALARSAVRSRRQPGQPTQPPDAGLAPVDSSAVVAALLAYGQSQTSETIGETSFTPHPDDRNHVTAVCCPYQ